MPEPVHEHAFTAGTDTVDTPFVLLHGSEGTESDLIPLAGELAPAAAKLGVRGTVAIGGGYAFFRRLPDNRVDEVDIAARTPVLAEFVASAGRRYNFTKPPVAIGYSNGAIMTAALLMTHPGLLAGAILFRPLPPFTRELTGRLDGTPVLIVDGANDSRRSPDDGRRVAERLRDRGARVTHQVLPVGHPITDEDARIAHDWLLALRLC